MIGAIRDWLDRRRALHDLRLGQKQFSHDWYPVFKAEIERAAVLLKQAERELAREILARARARFPDVVVYKDDYLNLLIDAGCYEEADALIGEGRRCYPTEVSLALCYVRVVEKRGDLEEAIRRCNSMRRKFPRVAEFYTIAATCLNELGREQEAEALYERGARKLPREFEMNVQLAKLAQRRKDWPEAMRRWEVVRSRFDHFMGPAGVADCLWEMGRREEAEALLADTAQKYPTEPWPLFGLARRAEQRGDLDEAAERWAAVRKRFPSFDGGYTQGAELARKADRDEEADKLLQAGVERCRWNLGVHLEYARHAHRRAEWSVAAERWALVLDRFPDCEEARTCQAEAHAKKGRQEESARPDAADQ